MNCHPEGAVEGELGEEWHDGHRPLADADEEPTTRGGAQAGLLVRGLVKRASDVPIITENGIHACFIVIGFKMEFIYTHTHTHLNLQL